MAKRGTETVVVRRAASGGSDDDFYGDTVLPPTGVAVLDACIIWPRASSASSERGITTISGLHIFVPHDALEWSPLVAEADRELRGEDLILARHREWRVDGDVGDWRKKTGNQIGYLFEVVRWAS